jgi:hypothetical protein
VSDLIMDDVLGDFFSEIEKVEHDVVSTENEGSSSSSSSSSSTALSVSEVSSTFPSDKSPVQNVAVSAPQVVQKAAAVEIKMVKAVPNITYASDSKTNVCQFFIYLLRLFLLFSCHFLAPCYVLSQVAHDIGHNRSATSTTSTSIHEPSPPPPPPPPPPLVQKHHHTHTTTTAPLPAFKAPLPSAPYAGQGHSSTPHSMIGAQVQSSQQPAASQPSAPAQQKKKFVRTGAGEVWVDDTLNDW